MADKTLDLEREEPIFDLNRQRNLFKIRKRGEERKVLFLRADPVLLFIDGRDGVVKEECRNFVIDLDYGEKWRRKWHKHIVGDTVDVVVLADR
jgi:hypothetical protein